MKTLSFPEIIAQIEGCNFNDPIGHPLENNVAWISFKKHVQTLNSYLKEWSEHSEIEESVEVCQHLFLGKNLSDDNDLKYAADIYSELDVSPPLKKSEQRG